MKQPFRCVETKLSKIEHPEDDMLKMSKKKKGEQAYQEWGIKVLSLTS